jgi:hypothetical protein
MRRQWDSFYLAPVTRGLYEWAVGEDHLIDEWWDTSVGDLLAFLFSRGVYDAFIINYPFLSKGFEWCPPQTLKILDTHDKFTGRRQLLAQNGIEKEYFHTTADQEKIALDRADLVWAIKEEEEEFFRELTEKLVVTLPHAEASRHHQRLRNSDDEEYLVLGLIGARNNVNRVNAERFLAALIPLMRRTLAPIKVRIAGGLCEDLEAYAGRPGIELMGRVEDTAEFYRAIDVVLIPMSFSTGLKIKAIEALSTGLPIVAQAHAMEGIPVSHPLHLCESVTEVVQECIELSYHRDRLEELRIASAEVNGALRKAFLSAIDRSAAEMCARPTIVMTIDAAFFQRYSLYREHILQLTSYLRYLGRIYLFLDHLPKLSPTSFYELTNGLGSHAKLVLSPKAVEGWPANASFGLHHTISGLADLLRRNSHPVLWLESLPSELKEVSDAGFPALSFVQTDSLRLLGYSASDVYGLIQRPELTLLGAHCIYSNDPRTQRIQVPYLRGGTMLFSARERQPPLILLVGDGEHADQMGVWYRLLNSILAAEIRILLPRLTLPGSELPANFRSEVEMNISVSFVEDLVADMRPFQRMPHVCIRFGQAGFTDLVEESALRNGVEVLTAPESTAEFAVFVQKVEELCEHYHPQQDWDESEGRHRNDAGYNIVWRRISGHALLRGLR